MATEGTRAAQKLRKAGATVTSESIRQQVRKDRAAHREFMKSLWRKR